MSLDADPKINTPHRSSLTVMADRSPARSAPHRYSLVAAAEVIASADISRPYKSSGMMLEWQERAWGYYDRVGEFRFGVGWTSNAMSRVNLTAAAPPRQVGDEPTPIDVDSDEVTPSERRAIELVEQIAGGASGQGQLLGEFGSHLSIAGFGWLVAEPSLQDPNSDSYETWQVLPQDALKFEGITNQKIYVRIGDGNGDEAWRRVHPNSLIVKVWRRHPRKPWQPDAPVRAVLGVLEIIELLTDHITASGRSRLAGAGLLAIPSETEFPPPPPVEGETTVATEQDRFDHFVEELTNAMTTPIKNRQSAAAVVPLPIAIPGEFIDKIKHISFSTPFDAQVRELMEDAIKRLALGLDMPPEVLTGMSGVNHWTAWQVEETAITLHIEPNAEIVCNALTEAWLKPALRAEGFDENAAMVWYDTSDLTSPPDKTTSAIAVYDRIQLSAQALRRETGFTDDDKPDDEEFKQRVLLDTAKGAPALAPAMLANAGILDQEIADVIAAAQGTSGGPNSPSTEPESQSATERSAPSRNGRPSQTSAAYDHAFLMACDGIADRAMEMAGKRLLGAIGKRTGQGPQAVDKKGDARTLHLQYEPTVYADLDMLLSGSFDRVPQIAEYLGTGEKALLDTMTAYLKGLLAAQHEHTLPRLVAALDIEAMA